MNTDLTSLGVHCLAISPAYATDHTLFAGTDDSVVFKSITGGEHLGCGGQRARGHLWDRLAGHLAAYATDDTVFTGTLGGGVFKSTTGGASWSAMNTGLTNAFISSVAVSPAYATDHTLFAGSNVVYSYTVPTPTLTASGSGTIAYGASKTVTGTLVDEASAPLSGRTLTLQSAASKTAATWVDVTTATTDTNGAHAFSVSPTQTTYYRVRFAGDTDYADAVSSVVSVAVQVYLSTPTRSSTVHVNKSTTFAGYLKPHHTAGAKSVQLQFYRHVSGKWVHVKTVKATNADHSTYTRYAASTPLGSKGSWRVRAYYPADAKNAATYSGWETFTVT